MGDDYDPDDVPETRQARFAAALGAAGWCEIAVLVRLGPTLMREVEAWCAVHIGPQVWLDEPGLGPVGYTSRMLTDFSMDRVPGRYAFGFRTAVEAVYFILRWGELQA